MKNFKIFIFLLTIILFFNISNRIQAQGLKKDSIWILKTDSVRIVKNINVKGYEESNFLLMPTYHVINFSKKEINVNGFNNKKNRLENIINLNYKTINQIDGLILFNENSKEFTVALDVNPFYSIGFSSSKENVIYDFRNVMKVDNSELDNIKIYKWQPASNMK